MPVPKWGTGASPPLLAQPRHIRGIRPNARFSHVLFLRRQFRFMPANIELSKEKRAEAVASMKKYYEEEIREPIGDLRAGLLLDFFLEDIGPAIYNLAIADAQSRLSARVADLEGELYAE